MAGEIITPEEEKALIQRMGAAIQEMHAGRLVTIDDKIYDAIEFALNHWKDAEDESNKDIVKTCRTVMLETIKRRVPQRTEKKEGEGEQGKAASELLKWKASLTEAEVTDFDSVGESPEEVLRGQVTVQK